MSFKFRDMKGASLVLVITFVGIIAGFTATKSVFAVTQSRFEKLELFNKVLYLIESQYYRPVDTEKLIKGAIKGMMETLDPHSNFLDEELFNKMQEETQGEFGGLGIEVTQKDGILVIITPIEDSPAFRAGIKPGDRIMEINHEQTMGLSLEDAIEKMRGKVGTTINLGVAREGEETLKYFDLKREIIQFHPVKFELVDSNYAFVRLTQFQKRSGEEIISAIKKMRKEIKDKAGVKGIILDLRNNPGGLLDEAVEVSSIFLKEGVVVSTEGRDPKDKEIRYVKKSGHKELELPLVVLVNGASASASEIVAGALQDHKRAMIMGSQSFGKGSVQTVAKIDEKTGVKLTIAQYMTPLGRKIQALGIKPEVELDEYATTDKGKKRDTRYVREKDLKNHLTATIETPEEKTQREELEKHERVERIKQIEERKQEEKEEKSKKSDDMLKKYSPKDDYQVIQAINYMKSATLLKQMVPTGN